MKGNPAVMKKISPPRKIAVIGLGYVGLPVAVAFGKQGTVIGYDKNPERVAALKKGLDVTNQISSEELQSTHIHYTTQPEDLKAANFYIVAVPTPVDNSKNPDMSLVLSASETIGTVLKKGDIVVYESTVYPGATEDECAPVLEKQSGLDCGKDFTLGYSPERINPSDKEHTFESIVKIVSGQDERTLEIVAEMYGSVVTAGIYKAPTIKTAEAAKVIENTQRDLNIALMNELALIFEKMGLDTHEVLEAAQTKWNFLPFKPGLVGGHCISVDPYYLTHKAKQFGYFPEVILAGRHINDSMGKFIAEQAIKLMMEKDCKIEGSTISILGFTFKENCPDIRNSKVIDIIDTLKQFKVKCKVYDPLADPREAKKYYDIELSDWDDIPASDALIIAVGHEAFKKLKPQDYLAKLSKNPVILDVKAILNKKLFQSHSVKIWRL